MRHIVSALLIVLCGAPPPPAASAAERRARAASPDAWVEKTLRSMSLDEKVGQLLIPTVTGGFRNTESDDFQKPRHDIVDLHAGGYHTFGGDAAGVALLLDDMQRLAKIPLLTTADLEGGAGYVIGGATRFPLAMAIGATGNESFAFQAGKATGEEGRAL